MCPNSWSSSYSRAKAGAVARSAYFALRSAILNSFGLAIVVSFAARPALTATPLLGPLSLQVSQALGGSPGTLLSAREQRLRPHSGSPAHVGEGRVGKRCSSVGGAPRPRASNDRDTPNRSPEPRRSPVSASCLAPACLLIGTTERASSRHESALAGRCCGHGDAARWSSNSTCPAVRVCIVVSLFRLRRCRAVIC